MEEMISISVREYKKLLEASIRIEVFSDFVSKSKYSIDPEDCGRYLGFKVKGEGN